ncbi:hypothetical protein CLOM_g22417 [Closterium sp. NIES-68]|nr:hypothetical protein CLOM_g22417 [Closterium sp. NIES-68]GJP70241.1 hypothetical protein CLOP_g1205 [Closterium sp. NIES-67]
MAWNDDYYMHLEKSFGRDKTFLVGESHRQAIDSIEDTVQREGIECKFTRLDGYLFPHDSKQSTMEMLHMEYEASKRAGFNDVHMVDRKGDPFYGSMGRALCFPSSAEFHPLMYLNGLADAFVRLGGRIFEQTIAFREHGSVTGSGAGSVVSTKDGRGVVHAGAVVLATNSPINHNLLVHARQPADRSYVVGLKLDKGSVKRANWWSTHSPYHYVRVEEQADHDVLVVGGGDHPVGMRATQYQDVWGDLERWARPRWPMAQETLFRWSGVVYEPVDLLGLYGRNPMDATQTYIATGDSGQGMTGGTIAAMVISDLICRRPNPFIEIYSPSRLPPVSMKSLSLAGSVVIHTIQGYKDWLPLVGTDGVAIEDLGRECGAVVSMGLRKAAVFRDKDGLVHAYSATCPHLGCSVHWNPNDATFDCPCHGSQFDHHGRCINGPAKADLAPLDPRQTG